MIVGIVLALVRDSKALVQGFLDTIGAAVLICIVPQPTYLQSL
jgi:hypothetical protein